jgi:hypothetical protein
LRDPTWFRRLGDIPGLDYKTDPRVDRRRLRGHDVVPRIEHFGGHATLTWGNTSRSPAHERAFGQDVGERPSAEILRLLSEILELPGEASDYHFAIQIASGILWARRRADPDLMEVVERLCWLDLRLIEAQPDAVRFQRDGKSSYFHVTGFKTLITLYEREGALREALEVAERAERFDQLQDKATELRQRLAAVEAEDRS